MGGARSALVISVALILLLSYAPRSATQVQTHAGKVVQTTDLPSGTIFNGNVLPGTSPNGIALDTFNGFVYVSSPGVNGSVDVYDPSRGRFLQPIIAGSQDGPLLYDPDNGLLYVASASSPYPQANDSTGELLVINPSIGGVVATISGVHSAGSMVYDPAQKRIYVTGSTGPGFNIIYVIDPTSQSIVANVTDIRATVMTYDPQNGLLYVGNFNFTVSVLDPASDSFVGTIGLQRLLPDSLLYDPASQDIYCVGTNTTLSENTVLAVLNPRTDQMVSSIPLGGAIYVWPMVYDDQNQHVYVGSGVPVSSGPGSSNVTVIDGASNSFVSRVAVTFLECCMTYDSATGMVYMVDSLENSIAAFNPSKESITGLAPLTYPGVYSLYDPDNRDMYFSLGASNPAVNISSSLLLSLNPDGNVSRYSIGNLGQFGAQFAALDRSSGLMYIEENSADAIVVFNTTEGRVVNEFSFPRSSVDLNGYSGGLVFDPLSHLLFIACYTTSRFVPILVAVNPATGSIVWNTTLASGTPTRGIEFIPIFGLYDDSQGRLYLMISGTNSTLLDVFNSTSMKQTATVTLPGQSYYTPSVIVGDNATNNMLYIGPGFTSKNNTVHGDMIEFSTKSQSVVGTINFTGYPNGGFVYDPADSLFYVPVISPSQRVLIVDSNSSVLGNLTVGSSPVVEGFGFDPANGDIYIPNWGSGTLSTISTPSSGTITSTSSEISTSTSTSTAHTTSSSNTPPTSTASASISSTASSTSTFTSSNQASNSSLSGFYLPLLVALVGVLLVSGLAILRIKRRPSHES
jgi:hypothetical protein